MKEKQEAICVDAEEKNLACVMRFVEEYALSFGFSEKIVRRLLVVCDEVFSNIVKFAYPGEKGKITVELLTEADGQGLTVSFSDDGIAFNPLVEAEPDITLPLEERPVGKLGLKIVKTISKSVDYAYRNDKNILTIVMKKQ